MPDVIFEHERAVLLHGDAKQLADVLSENSVDAIVTDPPAGIGFMNKGWDSDKGGRDAWIAWLADLMKASFRALKPGGHALVWAIPRTSHWTAMALEDAGFEIRDVHHHIFGTGFPKSLDISKQPGCDEYKGFGTALKPAVEHWILARKPLEGTYANNVRTWGTGILNIDGCRIGTEKVTTHSRGANGAFPKRPTETSVEESGRKSDQRDKLDTETGRTGRWPAHLSMDEEGAAVLDGQSGEAKPKRERKGKRYKINPLPGTWPADPGGGASRFFYVAKASRSEKDAGLEHLKPRSGGEATDREDGSAGLANPRAGAGRTGGARNFHPTVKNLALMKWLIRLITPPGGVVLDPFAGSGSTGVAAIQEGFNFIGCELGGDDGEYLPILLGRIKHALGIEETVLEAGSPE